MSQTEALTTLPANSAFLPINCKVGSAKYPTARQAHLLALVDADLKDELLKFNWRTPPHRDGRPSHVYRLRRDPRFKNEAGQTKPFWEGLGARILGIHENINDRVVYRNGDRLDLRKANLVPLAAIVPLLGTDIPPPAVPCGSTFQHLPEFQAALADRHAKTNELAALHRTGSAPLLSAAQVKELLEALSDPAFAPQIKGRSFSWINRHWAKEIAGREIPLLTLQRILRGKQQRIPGFDYAKLQEILPKSRDDRRAQMFNYVFGKGEKPAA
jgi:hypothetical protein